MLPLLCLNVEQVVLTVFSLVYSSRNDGWEFPSGPVVKTLPSNAGGVGSIPGWGAKILCALGPKNQNIKQVIL